MPEASDARTWLQMLFQPGEVFEVRTKAQDDMGAAQTWLLYSDINKFIDTHIPIHESNDRNIWVGICPRDKKGSTNPLHGRVLWCDLDNIDPDTAVAAAKDAELPDPSMVVNSGHGVHLYWKLDTPYEPEELRLHAKAIHNILPADNTHDPTRVMRVPGTVNPKGDGTTKCFIVSSSSAVYPLADFPKVENELPVGESSTTAKTPLSPKDRQNFVANWLDGQKHYMVLGVAGYLRKELKYTYKEALAEISSIHREAGYEVDQQLVRDVKATYEKPWAKVSGTSQLYDLGVMTETRRPFKMNLVQAKKPKIKIIDQTRDIPNQEFWIPGLVGPGLLTLWAAPPKTGKSFAAMQMAHALATGTDFYDMPTQGGPKRVLYFQGELSQQMVMERARNLFGASMIRDPEWFAMTDKPDEVLSLIDNPDALNDIAMNYDVIIVDPISAFNTNDENSATTVRNTISVFDTLKAAGKAVVIVHHTRKLPTDREGNVKEPTMNDIRGSGAWFAAVDAIAVHYRTGDSGNSRVKFRFRAAPDRDDLMLFGLPQGGFTHDRQQYLRTQKTLKVPVNRALN